MLARQVLGRKCAIQALMVLLIALAFVAIVAWNISETSTLVWTFRLAPATLTVPVARWMYRISSAPDTPRDFLREKVGKYFEKDGLCFALFPEIVITGACFLCIYFQNRFSGHASTHVRILPPLRSLRLNRHNFAEIAAAIECPGGAFGVVRIPFPIPAKYQGRRMTFQVGADTRYASGRGDLLRWREGVRVSATRELRTGNQLLQTLAGLAFGILYTVKPSGATITLPKDVGENSDPTDLDPHTEILWQPGASDDPLSPPHRAAA